MRRCRRLPGSLLWHSTRTRGKEAMPNSVDSTALLRSSTTAYAAGAARLRFGGGVRTRARTGSSCAECRMVHVALRMLRELLHTSWMACRSNVARSALPMRACACADQCTAEAPVRSNAQMCERALRLSVQRCASGYGHATGRLHPRPFHSEPQTNKQTARPTRENRSAGNVRVGRGTKN
jgi:hypothetical protein